VRTGCAHVVQVGLINCLRLMGEGNARRSSVAPLSGATPTLLALLLPLLVLLVLVPLLLHALIGRPDQPLAADG
jgi:hypothetical protein